MTLADDEVARLAAEYAQKSPEEVLALCFERFEHHGAAISFSGAEDVVLVDMACKLRKDVKVFALDTGRMHPETYRFLHEVREHYMVPIEVMSPDAIAVETLVREKGLFSFLADGHTECCGIRKVAPLRRKLATLDAWVTGQRRDQSPGTRAEIAVVEVDTAFSSPERALIKFNPLANWTSAQVWSYIRENSVPYNELHARGFVSIGCEPCTRPVLPNQPEREGRWWWESPSHKECGLHSGNLRRRG